MRAERRYRARAGDTLEGLIGEGAREAVASGSVFVDGVRVNAIGVTLRAGAEVVVGQPRTDARVVVLGEIHGLVCVNKPAELPTEPDRAGSASARSALARELGADERELHAVGRLDVGVSGLVLFARGSQAKRDAAAWRERGEIRRGYVGILEQAPEPASGRWTTEVDEKSALTQYRTLARSKSVWVGGRERRPALVALEPETGRKHQLRVHARAAGAPLVGDRAHGGAVRLTTSDGSVIAPPRIALHSRLAVVQGSRIVAPIPADLVALWRALGGVDSDWELVRDESVG